MRKLLLSAILLTCLYHLRAQNYFMESPEGFGSGATGGGATSPVTVTTYTQLQSSILAAAPAVILISGTITIPEGGRISGVVTNKTILGLPGAKLINNSQSESGSGILNLADGSNNVIIRNLIFEGAGAYDTDGRDNLTADGCTNLWVDHCEFRDGVDGNYDNRGNTDNVTISWCKFTYLKPPTPDGPGGSDDHRFTNLVGSGSSDAPADGHFSITFQNCYWADGCRERMPRARNAELHVLNCYYNTDVASSLALGLGGGVNNLTCYVENTDFAHIGQVYRNYSGDGGTVSLTFSGCLNPANDVGTVTPPDYEYTVMPVEDVGRHLTNPSCGAGATMQISAEGVITYECTDDTEYFTLTVDKSGTGNGTISVSPENDFYAEGTMITITATPNDESTFAGWSGGTSGTTNPLTITIGEDLVITAEFTESTATLVRDAGDLQIRHYPTLVTNELTIDFSAIGTGEALACIYSIHGQRILTRSAPIDALGKMKLDLHSLSDGIYICKVQMRDKLGTFRFIKK